MVTLAVGWVLVAIAVTGLAAHWQDTEHQTLLILAAGAYLLVPASILALVAFLVGRHWIGVTVGVAVVVLQVVAYGPLFVASEPAAGTTPVRVMTQNMDLGRADARTIVDRIRADRIDVVALEELTPQAVDALYAAGIKSEMPYAWWRSAPGAIGTGVWSRIPFSDPTAQRGFAMFAVSVELRLDTGRTVSFVAVHPSAPFPQSPGGWVADLRSLSLLMHERLPAGPVIVAGDFNSTWDHARFRALLTGGYHDAAEQAGAGFVRSWPADRFVPALGIDHVVTRGAVATSFELVRTPATDHRGVVSEVAVPDAT